METPVSVTSAASANPARDKPMIRTMIIPPLQPEAHYDTRNSARRPVSGTQSTRRSFSAAAGSFRDHCNRLVDGQRSGSLAWRIFLKRLEELCYDGDGGDHRPKLFTPPFAIVHRLVLVTFPRILPKVGHNWN